MQVWNVRHAARWKCRTQKVAKNCHLGTIAQLCRAISSQPRHISTIGKTFKQQYVLQMSAQYGEHRPTSGWDLSGSLGIPANFNGFHVLAALLHSSHVVSVSQTLRRWTEGATYVRQGDHHVGHWPTFLVLIFVSRCWFLLRRIQSVSQLCEKSEVRIILTVNAVIQSPHRWRVFIFFEFDVNMHNYVKLYLKSASKDNKNLHLPNDKIPQKS